MQEVKYTGTYLNRRYPSEYASWDGMRSRCCNPKQPTYPNYGGRGITVCPQWKSFAVFLNDMGEKPSPSHTIDRINGSGNYEPGNCRWANRVSQGNNKRNNIVIEANGRRMTLMEWSRELNVPYSALRARYHNGWSHIDIIEKPLMQFTRPPGPPPSHSGQNAKRQVGDNRFITRHALLHPQLGKK
jgi:hypothetical protein